MSGMDLADFLLARIAEDEARARAFEEDHAVAVNGGFGIGGMERAPSEWSGVKQIGWLPARVLAECEAKRRIVGWYQSLVERVEAVPALEPRHNELAQVLRVLALPYADHPDYRPEWRP